VTLDEFVCCTEVSGSRSVTVKAMSSEVAS
jgi:hypothetical protein